MTPFSLGTFSSTHIVQTADFGRVSYKFSQVKQATPMGELNATLSSMACLPLLAAFSMLASKLASTFLPSLANSPTSSKYQALASICICNIRFTAVSGLRMYQGYECIRGTAVVMLVRLARTFLRHSADHPDCLVRFQP